MPEERPFYYCSSWKHLLKPVSVAGQSFVAERSRGDYRKGAALARLGTRKHASQRVSTVPPSSLTSQRSSAYSIIFATSLTTILGTSRAHCLVKALDRPNPLPTPANSSFPTTVTTHQTVAKIKHFQSCIQT